MIYLCEGVGGKGKICCFIFIEIVFFKFIFFGFCFCDDGGGDDDWDVCWFLFFVLYLKCYKMYWIFFGYF